MKLSKFKKEYILPGKMDVGFLVLVIVLLIIGLIMLFSASYPYAEAYFNDSYYFIVKQAGFAAIGILIMLIASKKNG